MQHVARDLTTWVSGTWVLGVIVFLAVFPKALWNLKSTLAALQP